MGPRPLRPRPLGFTLFELLTAVTIFTIIIGAAYALFSGGINLSRRGGHHAGVWQEARTVLRTMEADLRSCWTGVETYDAGFKSVSSATEENPFDTVEFTASTNHPPLKGGTSTTEEPIREFDLVRVSYALIDAEDGKKRGLRRTRTKIFGGEAVTTEPDADEGSETLSERTTGLRLRFWDGSQWVDGWDSTQTGTYPKAVEITVTLTSTYGTVEETDTFRTKVWLPVPAQTPPKEEEEGSGNP